MSDGNVTTRWRSSTIEGTDENRRPRVSSLSTWIRSEEEMNLLRAITANASGSSRFSSGT